MQPPAFLTLSSTGVPYLPSFPAPPGMFETTVSAFLVPENREGSAVTDLSIRTLLPCEDGEWCCLGRSATPGNQTNLLCPKGTYCGTPSTLKPSVCDNGGKCPPHCDGAMPYCPAGSSQQLSCPGKTPALRCRYPAQPHPPSLAAQLVHGVKIPGPHFPAPSVASAPMALPSGRFAHPNTTALPRNKKSNVLKATTALRAQWTK